MGAAERYGLAEHERFAMVPEQLLRVLREKGADPGDLAAAVCILFSWRPEKGNVLTFSSGEFARLTGFAKSAAHRYLTHLSELGLVTLAVEPGRAARVDLTPLLAAMRGHTLAVLPPAEPPPADADAVARHLAEIRARFPNQGTLHMGRPTGGTVQARTDRPIGGTVSDPTVPPAERTVPPAGRYRPTGGTNRPTGGTVAPSTYDDAASPRADAALARARGEAEIAEADAANAPAAGCRSAGPRPPRTVNGAGLPRQRTQRELLAHLRELEKLDEPRAAPPTQPRAPREAL